MDIIGNIVLIAFYGLNFLSVREHEISLLNLKKSHIKLYSNVIVALQTGKQQVRHE
jgi:uncharacterized radical SAM superfamily protein